MTTQKNEGLNNNQIDHFYKMNHKNRGLAVIFNHEEFDDSEWPARYGTDKDRDNLRKTFAALNFDVQVHEDRKRSQMKKILEKLSKEDHSDNDCLVVVLLTHGQLIPAYSKALNEECNTILSHELVSYIRTKDKKFALQKVLRYFTNERCPSLANKPKIFLIQACQGKDMDEGMVLKCSVATETEMDSSPVKLKSADRILPHKDFFIAYASLPGTYTCMKINCRIGQYELT
ncbi:caspase-1-like isoform X2 [Sitodiplosis mosellana]|uniref:caspase-1-like isoform X2 n=1 Tax=Sitodiplosis mosellana TaxID=263140 RepID=UPI002443FBC8|nr:caspase-1-like isoform X2 [Sitodiplosis mosellana]